MPSKYHKKTDRPREYPIWVINEAVALARETSINNASRITGISTFTVRRHLIARGYKPKPRGCGIQHANGLGLVARSTSRTKATKRKPKQDPRLHKN